MSDEYDRVVWRGRVFNRRTVVMLEAVEKLLGDELTIFQGSYNSSVGASAGTHDGGGAVDLWCSSTPVARVVRVMRVVGFAAWFRPELWSGGKRVWGNHVHAIAIGDREMSLGARAQVVDYFAHRDGLKSHAHDPTWHPDPQDVFDYQEATDVKLDDKLPGKSGSTVGDALVAVLKMQEQLAKFRSATLARDRDLRARINALAKGGVIKLDELDKLLAEVIDADETEGGKS